MLLQSTFEDFKYAVSVSENDINTVSGNDISENDTDTISDNDVNEAVEETVEE